MLQVIQDLKTGKLTVEEVPPPPLPSNGVLVRNVCSLISPGTERASIKLAKASLLAKIQQRPDLFKQVLESLRKNGLKATWEKIEARLSIPKALGYSSAGWVIASSTPDFKPGDRVACAGQDYASHAEIVAVPRNLVAAIPEEVSFEEAAFTTLGAIALHGLRQAEVKVGEKIAVIGLGLIGLLTVQMVKASGCRVIGFDISDFALKQGLAYGADEVSLSSQDEALEKSLLFTQGIGVDAAIITASSPSNEPIELAAAISRDRAKIVILGNIKADLPRQLFYEKELEVRFSRSYGPGRYDFYYEEKGHDYPPGYVRWTENRNMVAFLDLLAQKKIRVKELITHRFSIAEAPKAYECLLKEAKDERERPIAIILDYPEEEKEDKKIIISSASIAKEKATSALPKNIGVIGAGHFAQSHILPQLGRNKSILLHTLADANSLIAQRIAKKYKFREATTIAETVIHHPEIEALFILTRHDSHARLVLAALEQGKKVYVEKPLAIKEEEIEAIDSFMALHPEAYLMVGFNRRFAPSVLKLKEFFSSARPLIINYRVNVGPLPKGHWLFDPEQGGRFIGEGGHFIDTIKFITEEEVISLIAFPAHPVAPPYRNFDNLLCLLKLSRGSIASISYFEIGDASFPKERIEIFGGGRAAFLDDFRHLQLSFHGKKRTYHFSGEKGHKEEIETVLQTWFEGKPSPIPYSSLANTTWATLAAIRSIQEGREISVEELKRRKER